jgi:hypothetical protein
MKKILTFWLLFIPVLAYTQVWQERFTGLANGTTSDAGATSWTTTLPTNGASGFCKQTPAVGYELFAINDTGSEGVWQSGNITISSYTEVAIEITLYSNYTFATDYIKCYYKVNGGAEVQFGELLGNNGLNISSAASAIVSGNTLQIIVRGKENTAGSTGGLPNALAFDDITVTNISVLYSRATGNWNSTGTWSTTGLGGADCVCTPNSNARVVIGNNVRIQDAATAAGVTIIDGGKLHFIANTTLTMARGGSITIENGGELKNNGGNGSILYGAYVYTMFVNGTLSVSTFTANSGASINFSGIGSLQVTDFLVKSSGTTITLNVSGGATISNDLNFQSTASNVSLINHQPLTVGNQILFASGNVSFYNSSTISTAGLSVTSSANNGNTFTNTNTATLNVGSINLNNGDFTLNNSGTINQTGNFSSVDNGSSFWNLDGSQWNFSGGGTNSRLFCNDGTNTFNYTANGSQSVLVPADSYSNLTLSGSGIKTLSGNLDIARNLTIDNTAQLDVSATNYTMNIGGNWNITSTHGNPFVERTGTVTFEGLTDQNLSTVLGTETFYNLIIDKSSGDAFLGSAPETDLVVTHELTLANGGLSLNGRTLNITNSAPTAVTRTTGCVISETTTPPYSQMKWTVGTTTGSFVFPFGRTNDTFNYIPFTFTVTSSGSSVSGTVSVMTYHTNTINNPLPSTVTKMQDANGADNSDNVVDRFWFITLDGYSTNPTSTVTFVATPAEVGAISALRAQRWNSTATKWDAAKSGQTNPTLYAATVPNVNEFSPWTMSGSSSPLPVNIMYFNAFLKKNNTVALEWKSAQEFNNNFYTVQKSIDLETYDEVAIVSGKGTSTQSNIYRIVDHYPYAGMSYYRLKQTDFNGDETYFKAVMINCTREFQGTLNAYPLPFNGSELTIDLKGLLPNAELPLVLSDVLGQQLFEIKVITNPSGNFIKKLILQNQLNPGVYILKGGRSQYLTLKVVVE